MKLKLKTISPVAIGDGGTISNISDYYLDNSKLYYINHEKVKRFFKQKPELIENFVDLTLRSQDNQRNKIDFKNDVIINLMKSNPDDYIQYSVPAHGLRHGSKQQIKTIIKTAGKPFIPGSSIKGAIKTAFLYDWLIENNKGNEFIDMLCNDINNNRINRWDIEKIITNQLKEYQKIRVSDSHSIPPIFMAVYQTHRFHLTNSEKKEMIPIATEAIVPGVELDFDLQNQIAEYDIDDLFNIITIFNQSVLWYEWNLIEKNRIIKKGIENHYNIIEKIIQDNPDKMYLRIGSGKSNFNNSIGLAIYNKDQKAFHKYRKIMRIGEEDSKIFPLTRAITKNSNKQLGWVEITKK